MNLSRIAQTESQASILIKQDWRILAILSWILVVGSNLAYYFWRIANFYHAYTLVPVPEIVQVMNSFGLDKLAFPLIIISYDLILVGAYSLLAAFLFLRRADNAIVFVGSMTLVLSVTMVFSSVQLLLVGNRVDFFVDVLNDFFLFLANCLSLLIIYALPDGRFFPKWTIYPLILSFAYVAAYIATFEYWSPIFNVVSRVAVFLIPALWIQIYRYRHVSSPQQRQQTKWLVLGLAIALLAFFVQNVLVVLFPNLFAGTVDSVYFRLITLPIRNLFLLALPMGLGFAMLRYRLWDVDLTLNRSLVFGLVTVLLIALFILDFFIINALLNWILPANHQVLAGVLAAAINAFAFNPARHYVRKVIDRRFYGFRFDLNELRAAQRQAKEFPTGSFTGKQVEGYRLGGVIGRGGMGEVYEGVDGNDLVAIKILPASYFNDESARRRFEREAQATKSLNHPNIVKVASSGFTDELAYIILQYLAGKDLKTHIREEGAFSLDDAKPILKAIASAIDYSHEQGIIHRDLKPSNIMLSLAPDNETYQAILMDFGLARMDGMSTSLTGSGAIGTIDYMSPEQILESRSVDHRSDIYALGIIVYEMLAAKTPFEGSAGQVMFAHLQQPAPSLHELKPEIPLHVSVAIQQAMAKDAHERYEMAGDFIKALNGESAD